MLLFIEHLKDLKIYVSQWLKMEMRTKKTADNGCHTENQNKFFKERLVACGNCPKIIYIPNVQSKTKSLISSNRDWLVLS